MFNTSCVCTYTICFCFCFCCNSFKQIKRTSSQYLPPTYLLKCECYAEDNVVKLLVLFWLGFKASSQSSTKIHIVLAQSKPPPKGIRITKMDKAILACCANPFYTTFSKDWTYGPEAVGRPSSLVKVRGWIMQYLWVRYACCCCLASGNK